MNKKIEDILILFSGRFGRRFFILNSAVCAAILLICWSCSGLKSLEEGEQLLTGYQIKVKSDTSVRTSYITEKALEVVEPIPNETILGIFRPGPSIYHMAGTPKKDKGFKFWLKNKIGSPPVKLSDVAISNTKLLIQNRLQNLGYFDVVVDHETDIKNKKAQITYQINLNKPYRIREIYFPEDEGELEQNIRESKQNTLLDSGRTYNLDNLKAERQRIESYLKNRGYFYYNSDYLVFKADSSIGNRNVDLYLRLKTSTPKEARIGYKIKSVDVSIKRGKALGNNFAAEDSLAVSSTDTVDYEDVNFISKEELFKPKVLSRYIYIDKGETFNYADYLETLNKLIDLEVFRFVNVRFDPQDTMSQTLDTDISLISLPKKNLRVAFGPVSRSNNFVGSELTASFRNRNVFRGAEEFTLNLNSGFETQLNTEQAAVNSITFGLELALNIPRFMTPFPINKYSDRYIPRTSFSVGYDYQKRTNYFELNSFNLGYGYRWKETSTRRHEFNLVAIEYNRLGYTSEEFNQILEENELLKTSFEDQFILGTNYNFYYDNAGEESKTRFYWNPSIDISGNLMSAVQGLIDGSSGSEEDDQKYILGLPYAQYFKLNSDLRFFYKLNRRLTVATRLLTGMGKPYGNSEVLPYKKQFFIGGTNSIRAFQARSLGPGTYTPEDDNSNYLYFDQTGDIKLEANAELRFDIYGYLKGAVFVDAGNIWTFNTDADRPGSQFEVNEFYKQLAIGTGLGIRVDASFFVLRADWGLPLRNPAETDSPWVIKNFGSSEWRKDKIILNIAIGYPF
ncbi:BamA/TamA family outer membrane protein [Chondrinema litorale]|uniref:translocation and assembly module lipoprotein TamL n=1 Tax=Chondrinema litorale TaxID=2994555 RepID=UPI002542D481|nr:BamA/TamA family outer membrane protein [Chondrinema litorale]UZR97072.1 BamA/TamA family outer membrane protein [Chondrinema litorale]